MFKKLKIIGLLMLFSVGSCFAEIGYVGFGASYTKFKINKEKNLFDTNKGEVISDKINRSNWSLEFLGGYQNNPYDNIFTCGVEGSFKISFFDKFSDDYDFSTDNADVYGYVEGTGKVDDETFNYYAILSIDDYSNILFGIETHPYIGVGNNTVGFLVGPTLGLFGSITKAKGQEGVVAIYSNNTYDTIEGNYSFEEYYIIWKGGLRLEAYVTINNLVRITPFFEISGYGTGVSYTKSKFLTEKTTDKDHFWTTDNYQIDIGANIKFIFGD